jgi:hypothetical protein
MLPVAGVPFAVDEAVNSWNEGNYVRSALNAVDAATLGVTPLGFVDAGFEAAEQNGSFQAQIDAERQAAGVTSAADIARQRYLDLQARQDQGLVRDIWFGNPHND